MIAEADLTADDAVIFNSDAATDAGLGSDHYPFPYVTVVSDMNHVVDLRAAANARPAKSCAIYTSVRPQFDVVFDCHSPDLGKLVITHLAADVAEAIGTNNYTSMENHSIAYRYAVFKENIRMNHAIAADRYVVANFCARANLCPITDGRIFTETNKRANKDIFGNFRCR